MREIQRVNDRLADVGIDVAWQARQPGFDRVDALADASEPETVDDAFDGAHLLFDAGAAFVSDGDRRCEVAEGNMIGTERLQGEIGIDDLVVGVAVEKLGRSEEHTSELQSLMRNSYAVFCLKKKNKY